MKIALTILLSLLIATSAEARTGPYRSECLQLVKGDVFRWQQKGGAYFWVRFQDCGTHQYYWPAWERNSLRVPHSGRFRYEVDGDGYWDVALPRADFKGQRGVYRTECVSLKAGTVLEWRVRSFDEDFGDHGFAIGQAVCGGVFGAKYRAHLFKANAPRFFTKKGKFRIAKTGQYYFFVASTGRWSLRSE